jgi:hypothetical protein
MLLVLLVLLLMLPVVTGPMTKKSMKPIKGNNYQ